MNPLEANGSLGRAGLTSQQLELIYNNLSRFYPSYVTEIASENGRPKLKEATDSSGAVYILKSTPAAQNP
jgi:hypothetical protein